MTTLGPLVCARRGSDGDVFPDSLQGICIRCAAAVVYRPHNAHLATRCICVECHAQVADPDDVIAATPRTLREFQEWLRKN